MTCMAPHTIYGLWNLVNVNDCYGPSIPYMECENLVNVNDLWPLHTLFGMWKLLMGSPMFTV